jgi:hypothetical protein
MVEKILEYYLLSPYMDCNDSTTGWQVFSDDDGAPEALIAEFWDEKDARHFCRFKSIPKNMQVYWDHFHDGVDPWQEPWMVVDASTKGYLEIWYPDRGSLEYSHNTIHIPEDVWEKYAMENFSSHIRPASTMPFWARFE